MLPNQKKNCQWEKICFCRKKNNQSPCSNKKFGLTLSGHQFLKGRINYTRYNSCSRDKSAILGITIPGIKMGSQKHYPWNSYSWDKFATLGIYLLAKGIPPDKQIWRKIKCNARGLPWVKALQREWRTKFFCIRVNMDSEEHTGNGADCEVDSCKLCGFIFLEKQNIVGEFAKNVWDHGWCIHCN